MELDVVLVRPAAAPLVDLDGHRPADHVPRGQILGGGGVALHEALPLGVGQIAALAAHPLGDQAAGAVDAGGMELHELHVLQRQPRPQHHRVAVAGTGVGRGAGEVDPAVAAGGEAGHVGVEAVEAAVLDAHGDDAAAGALLVHQQVEGEILVEELDLVPERLLEEGVQHGVAGAVGGGTGAIGLALAELHRLAAEGALVDAAVLGAREGHAVVLELVDRGRSVLGHVLDGVLVAQPVRPLDGVVHVVAPVVLDDVAERGVDAALGGHGVGAGGVDLGDAGHPEPGLDHAHRRPQTGPAGADDEAVVMVIGDRIGVRHGLSSRSRPGGSRRCWRLRGRRPGA